MWKRLEKRGGFERKNSFTICGVLDVRPLDIEQISLNTQNVHCEINVPADLVKWQEFRARTEHRSKNICGLLRYDWRSYRPSNNIRQLLRPPGNRDRGGFPVL